MIDRSTVSLLGYAMGALARRRAKAFALRGLTFAVALVSAVLFLASALRGEAFRARDALPDIVVQRLSSGRPATIAIADASKLGGIPSVRSIRPRVWGYVFLPELQGNVTVVGVANDAPPLGGVEKGRSPKGAIASPARTRWSQARRWRGFSVSIWETRSPSLRRPLRRR